MHLVRAAAPALFRDLHAAYVSAGAQILQTNTFGANRLRLAAAGLEASVSEINIAGARLAREAAQHAGHPVLVAGSVGPAASAPAVRRVPASARAQTLREQIAALCDWVDLLILETFGDLESLVQAVEVATSCSDLPVVAQLTFGDDGRTLRGEDPAEAAAVLSGLRVAALGANCTVGPAVLVDVVGELARATDLPVSVQPNAGVPQRRGRQVRYARNAAYFAEAAPRFVTAGWPSGCRRRMVRRCWSSSSGRRRCARPVRECWPSSNRRRQRPWSTRSAPRWCCANGWAARCCCRWKPPTATSPPCRPIYSARTHWVCGAELDQRYRSSVVDALVSGHFLDAEDAWRKARSLGLG